MLPYSARFTCSYVIPPGATDEKHVHDLTIRVTCPDCGEPLAAYREHPNDVASVVPEKCPGCNRRWAATILPFCDVASNITFDVHLTPARSR